MSLTNEILDTQLATAIAADPVRALAAIGRLRVIAAQREREAVGAALEHHTWAEIGRALGISRQAAHQRYGKELLPRRAGGPRSAAPPGSQAPRA